MNGIATSMADIEKLVETAKKNGHDYTTDQVIVSSLQDWAKELLDEGFEGSYFTPKVDGNQIHITDVMGKEVTTLSVPDTSYVAAFKKDGAAVVHGIELAIRDQIDNGKIKF
ncbi:hypothetical protein [Lacticaseibacillus zhaodongensis]|uniref:hypothetical protein n=1 Tax=Lacticaseibacillus zhaodongensis TaxID=2668065 RepID=UPI0012D2F2BD|nr:hypothetical protein [Lacticaseibacillus zhaodongensis]